MFVTISKQRTASVTARQQEILAFLSRQDYPCVGSIASAFGVSSAAATRAVNRLERKGLVTRDENEIDRRVVNVLLTSAGTEAIGR